MKVYVERRRAVNEGALLDRLAATCRKIGHHLQTKPHHADVQIVWGWESNGRPTLHCEQGWLPRWLYQISHQGINAESHARPASLPRAAASQRNRARAYLHRLRSLLPVPELSRVFAYASPDGDPGEMALPEDYVVLALQVEDDRNLSEGRSPYVCMMDLIVAVAVADPPWPVVIRPHPARKAVSQEARAIRNQDVVIREGTIHQVLGHSGCRGLITCNSNSAHDAMIWGRPVIALGRGVWPEGLFYGKLPTRDADWHSWSESDTTDDRLDYVAHLMEQQWSLDRAQSVRHVRAALSHCLMERSSS